MNCDQVFNVLTRGPFPTGQSSDRHVEAHLDECPDCWQIAEALRPALDVFQEAVPPAESRDLPGYWGDARPAGSVVADLAMQSSFTALAPRLHPAIQRPGLRLEPSLDGQLAPTVKLLAFVTTLLASVGLAWWLQG